MAQGFSFELRKKDPESAARLGRIATPHGTVNTPAFMPVGTQGAVRCLKPDDVKRAGAEMILANTYHLHLQPGDSTVAKCGGLHRFMGWEGGILTDSGGFQVFSLPKRQVAEEGVSFRFEKRGEPAFLSPEISIAIQLALGSDVLMAFDECIAYPAPKEVARQAMERTLRWADRSLRAFANAEGKALFGIVQGSVYEDLREESAERTAALGFPGIAIGGVSVGEGTDRMLAVVGTTAPRLPEDRPRYLMGVGKPEEIVEAVALGVDMFDCVIPTRHARGGVLFTARGPIRIENRRYRRDQYPIDTSCRCYACTRFSRAYVRHLYEVGEVLGTVLGSIHNIAFYEDLMARIRRAVEEGRYEAFRRDFLQNYIGGAKEAESEEETPGPPDRREEPPKKSAPHPPAPKRRRPPAGAR